MSTTYHPDGQTEVLNMIVEGYLRCFYSEQPKSWSTVLPWAEYWYNTIYQGAIRCTPFEIVYGRAPPSLSRFVPGETPWEAVDQELQMRDEALKQLRFHLTWSQDLMAQHANKRRRPANIKVEDWVYLKIRPINSLPCHPDFIWSYQLDISGLSKLCSRWEKWLISSYYRKQLGYTQFPCIPT